MMQGAMESLSEEVTSEPNPEWEEQLRVSRGKETVLTEGTAGVKALRQKQA